jgi:exopolysaccharide production protein ExoY
MPLLMSKPCISQLNFPSSPVRSRTSWGLASLKRGFDIAAAACLLLFLGPVLLALIIAVRLDGGPAFFRHQRIGLNGKPFSCFKLRSMVVDADTALARYLASSPVAVEEWAARRKLDKDPRITRLGQLLRTTSLDETPQLLNVLRGDMSLVGPRPVMLEELDKYYGSAGRAAYVSVRPGITGLWQVSGRSDTSYEERVTLDMLYVAEWSHIGDLKLLLLTVPAVFLRRGAT